MKKTLLNIGKLVFVAAFMYGCRAKDLTPTVTDSEASTSSIQSSDANTISANIDSAIDDVNSLLSGGILSGGRIEATCATKGTLTATNASINYDGTVTCDDGATRSGSISIDLLSGDGFTSTGAVFRVTYNSFVVKKKSNGTDLTTTLTGYHTVKNDSGYFPSPASALAGRTIVHKIYGNMKLYINDGTTPRTWILSRKLRWAKEAGESSYTFTVSSDSSISNSVLGKLSNVEIIGTNRYGETFFKQITTDVKVNKIKCWSYFPYQGAWTHSLVKTSGNVFSISNAINTGSNGCSSGYTTVITNKVTGASATRTLSW